MKPTEEQIKRATAHANLLTMEVGSRHRMEFSAALIEQWEAIRPQDDESKELAQAKADIAELKQRLHERTQAFLARESKPVAAAPLTFGEAPAGWTWRNPECLTPEHVEVNQGWRLYLNGEAVNESCQVFDNGVWSDGSLWEIGWTYRTQAPLPAPKPTPEEIERREFEEWCEKPGWIGRYRGWIGRYRKADGEYGDSTIQRTWEAWKAARAK